MLADWSAENLSLLDLRRVRQAIRRGWEVPNDVRAAVIDAVAAKLDDPSIRDREIISIGLTVLLADRANVRD